MEGFIRMYPILYSNTETNYKHRGLGTLAKALTCFVIEERNGAFELEMEIRANNIFAMDIQKGMIIKADANSKLKDQLFRIYKISKAHNNTLKILAQHISYDLADDVIEAISIENALADNALNAIFNKSQFSSSFKGYSDVMNPQNFSIERVNCLEAIVGKEGSIVDTYGNGAELLRDNKNIHLLKSRGEESEVLISYKKNLTGLEAEEDTQNLCTRIFGFVSKENQNEDGSTTATLISTFVDASALGEEVKHVIDEYSHPYIRIIDFSDKFNEADSEPTVQKVEELCKNHFKTTKCYLPEFNYKLGFVPLAQTEDYKHYQVLEDVNLCDKVIVRHEKLNIDSKMKVIKVKYNVLQDRVEDLELGSPKTKLSEMIGSSGQSTDNKNSSGSGLPTTPGTLPDTPLLVGHPYFSSVGLNWTFANKHWVSYQLYASQKKGFEPTDNDNIFEGKASAFIHEVKPNQTWYYKVRAMNERGEYTQFSQEQEVSTVKIDAGEYIENATIGSALIGTAVIVDAHIKSLNADKINAGTIKGIYIDARNLIVRRDPLVEGEEGEPTLHVTDTGEVYINAVSLKISNKEVSTTDSVLTEIDKAKDEMKDVIDKELGDIENIVGGIVEDLTDSIADGILTDAEKFALREHLTILKREYSDIYSQVEALRTAQEIVGSDAESELNASYFDFSNAYSELVKELEALINM